MVIVLPPLSCATNSYLKVIARAGQHPLQEILLAFDKPCYLRTPSRCISLIPCNQVVTAEKKSFHEYSADAFSDRIKRKVSGNSSKNLA